MGLVLCMLKLVIGAGKDETNPMDVETSDKICDDETANMFING